MPTLQIRVLGGLAIALDDAPLTNFLSSKVPALLAYLAVTRRAHSRDALAALFWGDLPDADAKNNLRQTLSNLKKLLEPHLDITRETVTFNTAAPYWLDIEEFDKAMTDTGQRTADGDRVNRLRSAVLLYRGEFLAGFFVRDAPEFEEWVSTQRARWHDLAVTAYETLTRHFIARGEYANAIQDAKQWLTLDPWREEAHRELMLLYTRTGQRSAALAQYELCRQVLREQLGVEPSAESNAWRERIRAASSAPQYNLPGSVGVFVGRVVELAQLEKLLLNPNARLITLLGVGGAGKTRLALEAAARVHRLGAFLNGVAFVALAEITAPEMAVSAFAKALGLPLSSAQSPLTQVTDYLRAKEMLVVLDNLESVIEDTGWLTTLLAHAPHVKFLATSREKLNLRAEWVMPLDGIAYPRARNAADVAAFEAVQLFVERAQQVFPAFRLDESNAVHVARVCELVQGLPLGIELAAAWARQYSCQELAREIESGYDILATSLRDVPARQASLRAVFEYSWKRLSERERAVWRKLAVFHGGWTRDAARAIAGSRAQELSALADKSLVRLAGPAPESRYDMHDLARQFAREKLEQDAAEAFAARTHHSEFFGAYVAAYQDALKGAGDQNALRAILSEFENVLAGWAWAWTRFDWNSIHAYMEPLFVVLEMRGEFLLGAQLYERARTRIETLREGSPEAAHVLGQLLIREGWMRFRLGDFAATMQLAQRGLPLLQQANDEFEVAYSLLFMGAAEWGRGEAESAQRYFHDSLALYEKLDDAWGRSGNLNNLGQLALERGDYAAAEKFLAQGLMISRAASIFHQTAHLLNNLAILAVRQGNTREAQLYLTEALEIAEARGETHLSAITQGHLAQALVEDDPLRAYKVGQAALIRLREFGDHSNMLELLVLLGNLQRAQNETLRASEYFREALTLARDSGASTEIIRELANSLAALPPP